MDSHLRSLIRSEGGALRLSARERALLEFTLATFGEPLSEFMLAGLAEEAEARSWLFTVRFDDERAVARRREIKVEPDERPDVVTLLPRRREPLVMLALLRLLSKEAWPSSPKLSYAQEEVLHLLGWEDSVDARSAIDGAVERYARLSYKWGLSGTPPITRIGYPRCHRVKTLG